MRISLLLVLVVAATSIVSPAGHAQSHLIIRANGSLSGFSSTEKKIGGTIDQPTRMTWDISLNDTISYVASDSNSCFIRGSIGSFTNHLFAVSFVIDSEARMIRRLRITANGYQYPQYDTSVLLLFDRLSYTQLATTALLVGPGDYKCTYSFSNSLTTYDQYHDWTVYSDRGSSDTTISIGMWVFPPNVSAVRQPEYDASPLVVAIDSKGTVSLHFSKHPTAQTIEVCDVLGQVVRSEELLPDETSWTPKALSSGVYIARLGNAAVKFAIDNIQ